MHARHVLSVLVENKPGVLTRIAGMFARRNYNIRSLAVGPTDDERISRLTLVVGTEAVQLEQIIKQLNKLVQVLKIVELEPESSVHRELLLVKVRADAATRTGVLEVVEMFRARVVDVVPDAVVIEATGPAAKLDALVFSLPPEGLHDRLDQRCEAHRLRLQLEATEVAPGHVHQIVDEPVGLLAGAEPPLEKPSPLVRGKVDLG
jgi:acetolactate synthase I/III small subunit